ncbi:MAG: right-handed parallel beta-helix repeat-containing protein [Ignavibacteriaceae bacterium]
MTKILSFVFIIICTSILIDAQIFVSPDGDDSYPGTSDKPYKTISYAMNQAYADTTVYLRGGVYELSSTLKPDRSGTSRKYIKLWAYPDETPILDFSGQSYSSSNRGFNLSKDYWYFKGLVIRNAGDNGINLSGNYNIIENCTFYYNKDTGLQISGGGGHNYVHNCDSFENYDPGTHGENADGFAPKLDVGPGNVFRGCRAWSNSDDGWDFYEAQNEVILDSCWSFNNGYNIWSDSSYQGDGNGFKVGGNYISTHHLLLSCIAFGNQGKGFDQNHNTAGITVLNCTGIGNKNKNFSFPEIPTSGIDSLINNLSFEGSNVLESSSVQLTNSWNGFSVSGSDFISLDNSLAKSPRSADSSIAQTDLFGLAPNSSLINAGTDVGIAFMGNAPDIGAFESSMVNSINISENIPGKFTLLQNYPNPFNPATIIEYILPVKSKIILAVFNLEGQKIKELVNEDKPAGKYSITFNAGEFASGVYFYELSDGNRTLSRKMILLK